MKHASDVRFVTTKNFLGFCVFELICPFFLSNLKIIVIAP